MKLESASAFEADRAAGAGENYRQVSYWLASSGDDLTPRQFVDKDYTVDVAILGGGFSGLWTAYYLLELEPSLSVAVVEREICGFGASGRNGGWCSPRLPIETAALVKQCGIDAARSALSALKVAADDIGRVCERESIDAEYRKTGLLSLARSPSQLKKAEQAYDCLRSLGLNDDLELLGKEEAVAYVNASNIFGGMRTSWGATVHPGKLVRGLARAVERRGGKIFEGTDVQSLDTGSSAALHTRYGAIRAKRAVVVAGEAYLAERPEFSRKLLPISSMIVLTEPLSAEQWASIGWRGGESLCSYVNVKNYLTRTSDGRILYGSRGAPYLFGSKLSEDAIKDQRIFSWMRGCLNEWWPQLEDAAITHQWGGYLGVTRNWMPTASFDRTAKIGQLYGYAGRGVATSAFAANLLAQQIANPNANTISNYPVFQPKPQKWEMEPFRWAGVRYIQNAYFRIDKADSNGLPQPIDAPFAKRLGGI